MKKKITGFFGDFKKFITKGNILDLAVAVVVGGAFGAIVTSLVNDIIMPLLGLIINKNLADLVVVIKPAYTNASGVEVAATTLNYGNFIQSIIDFLIIAFFIFLALKVIINIQKTAVNITLNIENISKKERNAYIKQLKQEGKTKVEIKELLVTFDNPPKPEVPKTETEMDVLKDIRELLKENKKD